MAANLVGKKRLVPYAHEHLNPLDYRTADGSCQLCGQVAISARHNCNQLRTIATPIAIAADAERERRQDQCPHDGTLVPLSHEEFRCNACGAIVFIPDE